MPKKDPRPQAAAEEQTQAQLDEKYASKEWQFAVLLIKHKGNATLAACEMFVPGKKGSTGDPTKHGSKAYQSAAAMGSQMLNNVKVQEYRAELARSHFNIEEAVEVVHTVMRQKKRPDLQLSAAESVLAHAGISGKKDQQNAPVVNLIMPAPPAPSPKKK